MPLKHSTQTLLTALLTVTIMAPVQSRATDLSAPVIRLSITGNTPESGQPLTISAAVSDNQALSRVLLRYRRKGSNDAFASLPMTKAATASLYSATIPATHLVPPGIEYYVEAADTTENISQEPFPSHPRVVAIAGSGDSTVANGGKINWLWIAAGVVAAGALAASGGGGSGSSSDDRGGGGTIGSVLTVTAPTP